MNVVSCLVTPGYLLDSVRGSTLCCPFGTVSGFTRVAKPDTGVSLELETTGAAIRHALVEQWSMDGIVHSLVQEYDATAEELAVHVEQFLRQLEGYELVEV